MSWQDEVDTFWERLRTQPDEPDQARDQALRDELDALADRCRDGDGRADFERAGVRDSTGLTEEAIGFYRRAIDAGLDPDRRTQAAVQLASSLRAAGDPTAALDVINEVDPAFFGGAPGIVRALTLHDLGRDAEAIRVAIEAAVPHLTRYQRLMAAYARGLTEPAEDAPAP